MGSGVHLLSRAESRFPWPPLILMLSREATLGMEDGQETDRQLHTLSCQEGVPQQAGILILPARSPRSNPGGWECSILSGNTAFGHVMKLRILALTIQVGPKCHDKCA